jgi:hypothetical protein
MKKFMVRMYATHYLTAIIEANSQKEAFEITRNANIDDFMKQSECYEMGEFTQISDEEASEYEVPVFVQTINGYEVKLRNN